MGRAKKAIPKTLKVDIPNYPNQIINLTIPIPPSVNHAYITTRTGQKILTKDALKFVGQAKALCLQAIDEQRWKKDKDNVWYYMDMYFYMPDLRIRDSHNCWKVLLDALQGILYHNDYFVMPRIMDVQLDRDYPRLEIEFYAKRVE